MSRILPSGFAALAPYVEFWAASTSAERSLRRQTSTEAERVAFFDEMKDLAPNALALLDTKPLDQFDEKEERLMKLLLSFAHVALAVEVQGDQEVRHAQSRQFLKITKAPADQRVG